MKKFSFALALAVVGLAVSHHASTAADAKEAWLTDYPKAQAQAKEQKKAILMDFTGSDWCPPCMQLKKTVLSSAEFTKFAAEKLVLVEVDFPENKKQSEALKKANGELEKKFKVDGYPTIIVVDAEGKELFRSEGYDGSSAKDYVAKLSKALNKK
ncbi:MAG TPA: thioredoxin family protein [Verrucomicrobiae bacterium]